MKNPYAPGFWCAIAALVLLSATYFYGVMLAHQLDQAMVFLDSAAALIAVMTVGLGAFAFFSNHLITQEQTTLQALQGETEQLRQRVSQVGQASASALGPEAASFVRQLGFAAVHDPIQMLATVRQAARPGVRVQRVQLVRTDSQAKPRFRVDGVVDGPANRELRRFLAELQTQGWQAESVSPNDGSPGAFAYLLKPVEPGKSL